MDKRLNQTQQTKFSHPSSTNVMWESYVPICPTSRIYINFTTKQANQNPCRSPNLIGIILDSLFCQDKRLGDSMNTAMRSNESGVS